MDFQDKIVSITMAGFFAAAAMGLYASHKQQEMELAQPIELRQLFMCMQPTGEQPFNLRSGALLRVRDRKTGEEYNEVQLDKTAPPPPGHSAWSDTRKVLGALKVPDTDAGMNAGVSAATNYCLKNELPPGLTPANPS